MERLPNRYPKISQSHKVPLYKGLSLFYPKLLKFIVLQTISAKNYELELNKRARIHTSRKACQTYAHTRNSAIGCIFSSKDLDM